MTDLPISQITLRDYLAANATDADIAEHVFTGKMIQQYYEYSDGTRVATHKEAEMRTREQAKYAYADAMIRARVASDNELVARASGDNSLKATEVHK